MDGKIVLNARVQKKDSSQAVVIAVTSSSIFDLEGWQKTVTEEDKQELQPHSAANENKPFKMGAAFPFIMAVQRVNEKLLEMNPEETLLFDVILLSKNGSPEIRSRVEDSVVHYGLDIGRFYFSGDDDFAEPLRSNNVKLFLSTDADDVCKALERGVPAAQLYQQCVQETAGPLRVLFAGDALGLSDDTEHPLREQGFSEAQLQSIAAAKGAMKEFATCMGEMRRRFGRDGSSLLCTCLMMAWSPRDVCVGALKTLRGWGLEVDEAFCLAGAPRSPILAHLQPHILYDHGLQNARNSPAQC
ncbi:hypothetical protein AAFF_G00283190 [Aldrovandia affinis]|uniref:Cytosolic 5'-nucleotidase 1A n=1 Tax=Aldrovandia affinis TaxID=143900 RepID=A0AAD7T9Y4_9TELE|nr:hypothetical protein AAFF_G00283190 [Aldrovandia affinis]